ncbi:MAG TPA: adventurous gliding motility lipoprotein CglC [Anaeromyxobacter sp.]
MRTRVPTVSLALAALAALAGCQDPDVGQRCQISWGQDNTTPAPKAIDLFASGGGDYFESGNIGCDGLVCIISPAAPNTTYGYDTPGTGYCSKACISNDDCYESKTGLVCRQMVLDPVFLDQLSKLDPLTRDRYLADIQFSSYCATPR